MDKKWWTLLAVCAGTFMLLLDVTIVVVALPDIQDGLHASFSDVQWVVDAYALTLASLLLTAGVLADRYGRRLLFGIGLVVFTAGSLLCGVAQSPLMLILSRSGQGVGGAIMFATSLALLAQSFRGRDRGVAFGVWGAIIGSLRRSGRSSAGHHDQLAGGASSSSTSRLACAVVVTTCGSRSPGRQPAPPDWAGFVLLTAGLVTLVYGLIRASEHGWTDRGVSAWRSRPRR